MELETAAAALADAGCPGAVAALRAEELAAAAAGLADLERDQPMTPAHRFRVGSITKTYVATLALLLAHDGVLDLDAPGAVPADPRLTLRMLLSHRSGLAEYMDLGGIAADREDAPLRGARPELDVERALSEPRRFEPGAAVEYCNTNYQAAGLAIERAAAAPLHTLVHARLLEPLRLARTTFALEARCEDALASGYAFADGWYPTPDGPREVTAHLDGAWADGAIVADAADVTAFFAALLGGRILPPAALAEMQRGEPDERGIVVGLGLNGRTVGDTRVWGHGGDMPGYTGTARAAPDGSRVFAVLVNAQGAAIDESLTRVADELTRTFL
jgi:D-alanyl-D-alanine carboxypeptidase